MTLKIIGAGLGRTGTLSLKFALEHLGFGPCYHMTEVISDLGRALPLWLGAVEGKPDWDATFAGYAATVDYPGCYVWRDLAAHFPEAKIILSVREAESWFASVSSTIFSPEHRAMFEGTPMEPFMAGTVVKDFGDRITDRAFMVDYYERWNQAVIDSVDPARLLVYPAGDGWDPLCAFLGVPVPSVPYPRVNSREDMHAAHEEIPPVEAPLDVQAMARAYLTEAKARAFGSTV